MTRRTAVILLVVVVLWVLIAPVVADRQWWDPLTTQIVGVGSIALLVALRSRIFQPILGGLRLLGKRWVRWGVAASAVGAFILANRHNLPWWWSEASSALSGGFREIGYWLEPIFWGEAWGRAALIISILGGLVWFTRRLGGARQLFQIAKAIPVLGALFTIKKWWEMAPSHRIITALGSVLAVIYLATGSTANFLLLVILLMAGTYRWWPRKNPFAQEPVDEFELPVFRAFGYVYYIPLIVGYLIITAVGQTWFLLGGYQLWTFVLTILAGQIFFMWFVEKKPGVANAWTRVIINPVTKHFVIDQARGGTGEIRHAPLTFGSFGLKETKGMMDNLLRLLGIYLFEIEPVGFRPQEGETIRNIEAYIQCAHFQLKWGGREYRGARALLAYMMSLK